MLRSIASVLILSLLAGGCAMPFKGDPVTGPDSGMVVDAAELHSCMGTAKPEPNWTVGKPDDPRDHKLNALAWTVLWGNLHKEWGSGKAGASFIVTPSSSSAKHLYALFDPHSEVTGKNVRRYGNLITFTSSDSPAPSAQVNALISKCIRKSTNPEDDHVAGAFHKCSQTGEGGFYNRIAVRGSISCQAAVKLLVDSFNSDKDKSKSLSAQGYYQVSENICCANDGNFATNGSSEIVYVTSV